VSGTEAAQGAAAVASRLATPALVVDTRVVSDNVAAAIALAGGAHRWRPHVKTTKSAWVFELLLRHGVTRFKCATPAELAALCAAGAPDVLVAMSAMGGTAEQIRFIAGAHPGVAVSVLVDDPAHLPAWEGSQVRLMIDVDVGMHRTGVDVARADLVLALLDAAGARDLPVAGLHSYDGHVRLVPEPERARAVDEQLAALAALFARVRERLRGDEVVTSGTPSIRFAAASTRLTGAGAEHVLGAGTLVFNDSTSLAQLAPVPGFAAAATVLTRVVSRPSDTLATCDAGSKAVSVDAGVPHFDIVGRPELEAQRPSEEHGPILASGSPSPQVGEVLTLLPRHVCTTVGNFEHAVLVAGGEVVGVEPVTARARLGPLGSGALQGAEAGTAGPGA